MPFIAQIPYGAYWSTPFAKWQGTLSHLHSIEFGAHDIAISVLEVQKNSDCVYIIMNSKQMRSVVFEDKFYMQLMKNNLFLTIIF